jgi:hypothetical protein
MKTAIQLDAMLTKEQAATWMQMKEGELMKKHRAGIIRGFAIGHNTIRWNPRSVISQLAKREGMSPELIGAMFGLQMRQS